MSAALAHEIQPLTAQRMQLATLRLLLDQGRIDEACKALNAVDQQLTRMAALTGHLKTFARKSPSGLRERLDLATVVDQPCCCWNRACAKKLSTAYCTCRVRPGSRGDAIRLEQVLINLLRNALDAMRDCSTRRLEVRIDALDAQWRLSVSDTGTGIAPENLARIFDPFFTTKPVGDGLGLGLAVSYAIIHQLGGQLTAESHANGAVFWFCLPNDALET